MVVQPSSLDTVHVRTFGAFEVRLPSGEVVRSWPSRRASELVQLLALSPGHRLVRDVAIDALWPQLELDAGAANLRKAAHFARRSLGHPDAVQLRGAQVVLFPDVTVTTDVEAFEAHAEQALATGAAADAAAALALVQGELLPEARYERWADAPRRHVEELQRRLLRLAGRWEVLLELDPLDEAACREAMRAALEAGNRHRAIGHYGRLRAALLHDLGVVPDASTEALYEESLGPVRDTPPDVVGREAELARIDRLLTTPGDRSTLLLLKGSAGVGTSTMGREVAARAEAFGRRVVVVTAHGSTGAQSVITDLVERLLALDPGAIERLPSKARSVLALLTSAVGSQGALEVPVSRHQLLGAVQRLLAEAAGDQGLAVVVDDAHLADDASVEVLVGLVDRDLGPVLVVLGHRPERAGAALRRAARGSAGRRVEVLDLGPLDIGGTAALAGAAGRTMTAAELDALHERAGGNPLLTLELLRSGTAHVGPLGTTARATITERFVDLDADSVACLRRLALVSGPISLADVMALCRTDEDGVAPVLDEALAAGVLVVEEGAYRFTHEVVRDALVEQLAPHERAAAHREAAEHLARLGADPAVVAHHWSEGGRPTDAIPWLVQAADDAVRLGGYANALQHLDLALGHDPTDLGVLVRRAKVLDALGDPRAIEAYAAAMRVTSAEEAEELRPLQALAQIKLGDPHTALALVEGARPQGLEARLALALTWAGAAALGVADPARGTALAEEGRRLAFEAGDPGAIVVASWAHAAAAHARGELRTSLRTDLRETAAIPELAVTVFDGQLCINQRLLYGGRPYDDVVHFADAFAAEATRLGAARGLAFAITLRGEAELLSGHLDAAEVDLGDGCRRHRDMGAATGEALGLQRLAEVAMCRGDLRTAHRSLDEALAVARDSDIGFHLLDRIYGTRIALAEDPDEALAAVVEAEEAVRGPLETCPGCRITFAVPAAIASARAGDLERVERYEPACEWLADVVMRLPAWDAALDEVRGHRALAHGDVAGARAHLGTAALRFAQVGQPFDAERCRRTADEVRTVGRPGVRSG